MPEEKSPYLQLALRLVSNEAVDLLKLPGFLQRDRPSRLVVNLLRGLL